MLDLNDLRIFVTICENRGILRAARVLELPKSTVSRRLAALEEQIKGRLVIRSGEEFQLTPLGAELFPLGRAMLDAARHAEDLVAQGGTEMRGRISLNAAPLFEPLLARAWPGMAAGHPRMSLAIDGAERSAEPAGAFDLSLSAHAWPLRDSAFIQRRICRNPLLLVVARDLACAGGDPASVGAGLDLLAFGIDPALRDWRFEAAGGAEATLRREARVVTTQTGLLRALACAGQGLALMPEYAVRDDLAAGRLRLAAPGWVGPAVTVALLTPARRLMNAGLRRFADELAQRVKAEILTGAAGVPDPERALPPPGGADVTGSSSRAPSPAMTGPPTQTRRTGPTPDESEPDMTPFLKAFGVAAVTAAAALPRPAAAQDAAAQRAAGETAPDAAGPLVLYTNDFEGAITARFEADTGHQIDVVQMSGGELLARVAAEAANPQWDVLIFNGSYSLHALDRQDRLKRDVAPRNLGALNETGLAYLPANQAWFPIGLTASCVMMYRSDLVDRPPTDYADLADPRFNGGVGMADPAVAAPAYPCVAEFFHRMGRQDAEALFTGYFDNGLRVFRTNGPVGRALASGEISVALITGQVAYATKAAEEFPVEIVWPEDGAPGAVRGVGVQAGTPRPEAARDFVDWLLTPATQAHLIETAGPDGIFEPTVQGVPVRPEGLPQGAVYRVAPDDYAVENEAAIKSWFADRALQ